MPFSRGCKLTAAVASLVLSSPGRIQTPSPPQKHRKENEKSPGSTSPWTGTRLSSAKAEQSQRKVIPRSYRSKEALAPKFLSSACQGYQKLPFGTARAPESTPGALEELWPPSFGLEGQLETHLKLECNRRFKCTQGTGGRYWHRPLLITDQWGEHTAHHPTWMTRIKSTAGLDVQDWQHTVKTQGEFRRNVWLLTFRKEEKLPKCLQLKDKQAFCAFSN